MALKRLTDISTTTGVTLLDYIHIVNTGDTSQYPSGSSYKATLQQVADSFSGLFTFTGNTSGDCITDLFVKNLNSCSPLRIQNVSSGNVLIGENGGVNVGIGTSTPSYRVHIMAADASNPVLLVRDNTNTFDIASINGDGYTTVRGFNIGTSVNTYATSNYTTLNGTATIQQYNKNLYFTTTDSALENLLIYSDGSAKVRSNLFVGNVVDTTSRIYVRGADNTSSNYGLKVQNSGGTNTLQVRNDGNVGIGEQGGNPLYTFSNYGEVLFRASTPTFGGQLSLLRNDNTKVTNLQAYNTGTYFDTNDLFFRTITGTSQMFKEGISGNFAIGNNFTSPTAKLDILGDTTGNLLKINNNNFLFSDKLRIENNGSFHSGSINAFGGFGVGDFTTNHLNYNLNTSFSTYLAFTNNGNLNNISSYGIIGGGLLSADTNFKLTILNNDNSFSNGIKILSTGSVAANDGFNYYNYGLNILNNGTQTNSGSGIYHKIGLNVDVNNGDINYAALFNGGNVGIGTSTPSEKLEVNGNIKTAQPSANGAGAWKLGKKVTATVSLVTTDYIEVEIDSVVYKLALVS
jgi:hypothetical protein